MVGMEKVVFLLNFLKPAGLVASGSEMRIGRAGASGSKKLASWNRCVGALSVGGCSGPQSRRRYANRTTNQPASPALERKVLATLSPKGSGGASLSAFASRARTTFATK